MGDPERSEIATPLGIDFGTTYTVVAAIRDGRPVILPNSEGAHQTPSVVCFLEGSQPVVGEPALRQAEAHPDRIVSSIKRRIGSGHKVRTGTGELTPEEVAATILRKVKHDAECFLEQTIDRAVITVPAYFNHRQREAIKDAANLAGIEVLSLLNEPTAAALAYGLGAEDVHTVLVWDLGGGTFDVSILELGGGVFEVRAVSGDASLGGDDWDARLAEWLSGAYAKACGATYAAGTTSAHRLRVLAERAKRELSSSPATRVRLPLGGGADSSHWDVEVTRRQLEDATRDLLERLKKPTYQALADAGVTVDAIDRILLVGGATRMPAIWGLARQLFGKEPYRYIRTDEVVSLGAAIHAGMMQGVIDKAVLVDVLPLSLGVETEGGLMARIIRRNTPVPATGSRIFTTAVDYQASMEIHVLQGERELAAEDVSLGRFELSGIPSVPKGVPKVEVTFEADVDGLVRVSAQEIHSGNAASIKVLSVKSLDRSEIESLAAGAPV